MSTVGATSAAGILNLPGRHHEAPLFPSLGSVIDRWIDTFDSCPWPAHAGTTALRQHEHLSRYDRYAPLYTPEERRRRDESPWTIVQGVLAPVQFAVFLVSLCLVVRYLATGEGFALATASIVIKTLILYAIMITGSIWEKHVFGRYLFARAFFWEDVFSILVLALHTANLAALVFGWGSAHDQMLLALAAYAAYVINATQFLLKLRAARRQESSRDDSGGMLGLVQ